ncbi:hypothetical protein G6F50_017792 [Rhizopus delemar]|uniref:Ribonucleotide reductase large subunit C-terminal domain-containing protein n=1 Tax=Rhizopus delemar TaxID=936053 RepID=A0A9P6XP71_9FUNG|nr:hypothetical protein G6F50_017792 [Rhizopus delemar]
MKRVEADQEWSLFDPRVVPEFTDLFGEAFEQAYLQAEAQGKANRTISARKLYARMMRTLAETDPASGQRDPPVQPVHRNPGSHFQR